MDYSGICYTNNFLTNVILRFDFAAAESSLQTILPKTIKESAAKNFPNIRVNDLNKGSIVISNSPTSAPMLNDNEWVFSSDEGRVSISSKKIFIDIKKYNSFESMLTKFNPIKEKLLSEFPNISYSRIGLRYINVISCDVPDPITWGDYIKPEFLTPLNIFQRNEYIRAMLITESDHEEFKCRTQVGIHNADYPSIVKRKEFLIDLDAYVIGLTYDEEVDRLIDKMHLKIQTLFESMITDELRRIMQ